MSLTPRHPRTRPIGMGHLRAFEAVARHLNFRAAAEELSLTQSAVSRQIQSLEDEVEGMRTTIAVLLDRLERRFGGVDRPADPAPRR